MTLGKMIFYKNLLIILYLSLIHIQMCIRDSYDTDVDSQTRKFLTIHGTLKHKVNQTQWMAVRQGSKEVSEMSFLPKVRVFTMSDMDTDTCLRKWRQHVGRIPKAALDCNPIARRMGGKERQPLKSEQAKCLIRGSVKEGK